MAAARRALIPAVLLVAAAVAAEPPTQVRQGMRFAAGGGEEVEALVFYQDGGRPCPVVVFSHDLGRSPGAYWWLGERWSQAGIVAVFPRHTGSDDALVRGRGPFAALAALRAAAADPAPWRRRIADLQAVVDGLDRLEADIAALRGRLLRGSVGAGGQGVGAEAALVLAGLRPLAAGQRLDGRRPAVAAALALSPPGADRRIDAAAFAGVQVPVLLMAGGRDEQPAGDDTPAHPPAWREEGFALLPAGLAWLVRLPAAHHVTFANGGWGPRVDPRHTAAIAALSTAFWRHTLAGDAAADPLAVPAGLGSGERR